MPLLLISFFALAALFAAAGLPFVSKGQSNAVVRWAKEFFDFATNLPVIGGIPTPKFILKLTRLLTHELGKAYSAVVGRGVAFFSALGHYSYVVGYWSLYWPIALKHEVDHLRHKTIPNIVATKTKPLAHRIDVAEAEAKAAAGEAHSQVASPAKPGTVQRVTKIQKVAMPHAKEWEWIHDHWKATKASILGVAASAAGAVLPHAPTFPVPWRADLKGIRKRLHRVEGLLGVSGFALVLSRLLGVRTSCLRGGGNLGKAARRICGLDSSLFNSLMLDLVAILSVVSVVEFANDLRAIEDEALDVLGRLVREFPS